MDYDKLLVFGKLKSISMVKYTFVNIKRGCMMRFDKTWITIVGHEQKEGEERKNYSAIMFGFPT